MEDTENRQAYTETPNYRTSDNIATTEIRKPCYHIVAFDEKTAESVISRDGKDLTPIGNKSNVIYFAILSSKFDDFIKNLKEGEGLEAEVATRERLNGFLPEEFLPNLEAISGALTDF